MLTTLLNSPTVLAAVIATLSLLNYAVGAFTLRDHSRQTFVERESYDPPGPIGKVRSNEAQLALPFLLAIVVIAVTLSADGLTREIVGGGYLVALLAGFALNVTGWLTAHALVSPTAAQGRIRYAATYRYRSFGAQTLGLGCSVAPLGSCSKIWLLGWARCSSWRLRSDISGGDGRPLGEQSNNRMEPSPELFHAIMPPRHAAD